MAFGANVSHAALNYLNIWTVVNYYKVFKDVHHRELLRTIIDCLKL
jgi:hypothetical protein